MTLCHSDSNKTMPQQQKPQQTQLAQCHSNTANTGTTIMTITKWHFHGKTNNPDTMATAITKWCCSNSHNKMMLQQQWWQNNGTATAINKTNKVPGQQQQQNKNAATETLTKMTLWQQQPQTKLSLQWQLQENKQSATVTATKMLQAARKQKICCCDNDNRTKCFCDDSNNTTKNAMTPIVTKMPLWQQQPQNKTITTATTTTKWTQCNSNSK